MNQREPFAWKQVFYVSNVLSIIRPPVALFFVLAIHPSQLNVNLAFVWASIACASDFLDGYIARKRKQVTELGIKLDPLADKIAMAIVVIGMWWYGYMSELTMLVVLSRDAVIIAGVKWLIWFYPKAQTPMSDWVGKAAVNVIVVGVLLHFTQYTTVAVWLIWIATIASLARYGCRLRSMINEEKEKERKVKIA